MTDTEILKRAEKYIKGKGQTLNKYDLVGFANAETDFLSKHILELQKDKGELTDKIQELEAELIEADNATDVFNAQEKRIAELEAQIEKMKLYAKLLQDICVVLGNDNFMVAVQLESVVKKLWDVSEEKEGLKMVEDIENRLLKIKPQDWAEITEWEIKEK